MPEPWDYGRGPRSVRGYAPSQATLRRGRDRNLFRLPDGPWFPWSREFRWDLMPWNRRRDAAADQARQRRERYVLVEAAGATIGPVARSVGLELNAGACGEGYSEPGGRTISVLYEGDPAEVSLPDAGGHAQNRGQDCVDLWVTWYPDYGEVDVSLEWFGGVRGLERAGRPDLIDVVVQPAMDPATLREVLAAYAEGLEAWLARDA